MSDSTKLSNEERHRNPFFKNIIVPPISDFNETDDEETDENVLPYPRDSSDVIIERRNRRCMLEFEGASNDENNVFKSTLLLERSNVVSTSSDTEGTGEKKETNILRYVRNSSDHSLFDRPKVTSPSETEQVFNKEMDMIFARYIDQSSNLFPNKQDVVPLRKLETSSSDKDCGNVIENLENPTDVLAEKSKGYTLHETNEISSEKNDADISQSAENAFDSSIFAPQNVTFISETKEICYNETDRNVSRYDHESSNVLNSHDAVLMYDSERSFDNTNNENASKQLEHPTNSLPKSQENSSPFALESAPKNTRDEIAFQHAENFLNLLLEKYKVTTVPEVQESPQTEEDKNDDNNSNVSLEEDNVVATPELEKTIDIESDNSGKDSSHESCHDSDEEESMEFIRACASFFYFCQEERVIVRDEFPELKPSEVTRELGRRWIEANSETRSKYEEIAENARSQFERLI